MRRTSAAVPSPPASSSFQAFLLDFGLINFPPKLFYLYLTLLCFSSSTFLISFPVAAPARERTNNKISTAHKRKISTAHKRKSFRLDVVDNLPDLELRPVLRDLRDVDAVCFVLQVRRPRCLFVRVTFPLLLSVRNSSREIQDKKTFLPRFCSTGPCASCPASCRPWPARRAPCSRASCAGPSPQRGLSRSRSNGARSVWRRPPLFFVVRPKSLRPKFLRPKFQPNSSLLARRARDAQPNLLCLRVARATRNQPLNSTCLFL